MAGSGTFSGLAKVGLGLFGKKGKTEKHFLSDELLKQSDQTTAGLSDYRTGQSEDLNRILSMIAGAQPQIAQIGKDDLGTLGNLIAQQSGYRPIDVGMQYGDYATNLLGKFAKDIAGYGRSADNLLLANLGHGGQGGSTFQTNTILDRISKNIAPVAGGIIQGIPAAVGQFALADNARTGNIMNLVNQRAGIPLRGAQAEMLGGQVRSQNLADQIAALTGLGGAYRNQYLGSEYIPTRGEQIAGGLAETGDSLVDTYMSMYTGGLGTGGGGIGYGKDYNQQLLDILSKQQEQGAGFGAPWGWRPGSTTGDGTPS